MKFKREVFFAVLTLIVAELWIFGTYYCTNQIRTPNNARVFMSMFSPGGGNIFFRALMPPQDEAELRKREEDFKRFQQQRRHDKAASLMTEEIVARWERMMYSIGGILVVAGLVSLALPVARPVHLLAGVVILASLTGTWIAMQNLWDPNKGDVTPLPTVEQAVLLVSQGIYGVVLLAAFARKGSPQTAHEEPVRVASN